nr:MAG TPA: hypothetical protein [Caudoviricetes sp.]
MTCFPKTETGNNKIPLPFFHIQSNFIFTYRSICR